MRLLSKPELIEATAQVPDGPPIRFTWRHVKHQVTRAEGPERIASEWWRRDAATRAPYFFELREYQAMPQKIQNVSDRFGGFTVNAFKKYGFRQVGYWRNAIGANDHQLVYMLAWESLNERVEKFDAFGAAIRNEERPGS